MKHFSLICAFIALSITTAAAQVRIAVMSDIHIMAPELLEEEGEAFDRYISNDRKLLKESPELLRLAVKAIMSENPDIVLIPGDLTKDGELVSHRLVSEILLKPLRDNDIPVYVIPGNHDVNNPHAVIFNKDSVRRTTTVSAEEFADIYRDYGYGDAIARDNESLTYVAAINDSLRLIAIDACRYEDNDYEMNTCVTGGRIKPETIRFIRRQARIAEKEGCRVIAMMHHGLVRHWKWQDLAMGDYLVKNWKKQSSRFGRYGINVVFTGHFHAQDIASHGKGDNIVYDIETGSTVSYPMPYRIAELDGNSLEVATGHICTGKDNEMEKRAIRYAEAGISTIVAGMVPDDIPEDIVKEAAGLVGQAYIAHIAGDESIDKAYEESLDSTCGKLRPHSFKYSFILSHLGRYLHTDTEPADNDITIEVPSAK